MVSGTPEHEVEQRVDGDLAEQRVREQLGVVVEADERRPRTACACRRCRMSVKLMPRLASTGPSVNTRNSTQERQGQDPRGDSLLPPRRVHVPSTGRPPDRGVAAVAGVTTWWRLMVRDRCRWTRPASAWSATASAGSASPLVAFSISLSIDGRDLLPASARPAGPGRLRAACRTPGSCWSSASSPGLPGALHGGQVARPRRTTSAGSRARTATARTSRRRRGSSASLKTARSPPPMNDVPGPLSLPGSGATAYLSLARAPASSTRPMCHGPEMNEPYRAVGEAALELTRVEQAGSASSPRRRTTGSSRAPRSSPGCRTCTRCRRPW